MNVQIRPVFFYNTPDHFAVFTLSPVVEQESHTVIYCRNNMHISP